MTAWTTTAHDKNNPIAGYTLVCCLHSRLLVIVCLNVCSDLHVFISSPQLFHTDTRIPVFIVLYDITLTLTWKSFSIKVLNENNKDKNQLFLKLYLLFSELCFTKFWVKTRILLQKSKMHVCLLQTPSVSPQPIAAHSGSKRTLDSSQDSPLSSTFTSSTETSQG